MTVTESVAGPLVEALSRGLPGDRIVTDPDVLAAMSADDAEWAPAGRAAAGVRARSGPGRAVQSGQGVSTPQGTAVSTGRASRAAPRRGA